MRSSAYLSGGLPILQLPLDIRATAFQRRVWEKAVAANSLWQHAFLWRGGRSNWSAHSCARRGARLATNPVALVVPCHRVIGEDKSLGGYRWGLARKTKLLAQEKAKATKAS